MLRRVFILVLAMLGLLAGGCYERTVSSKGLGGMGSTVQDSYRSNTALDRAYDSMFGPTEKTFKGADNTPLRGRSQWSSDSTGGGVKGTLPTPGSAQGASSGN